MAGAGVEDILDFFRGFIDLCQSQSWPESSTTPESVRNVLLTAQHIEKSVLKVDSERNCLQEFLSLLWSDERLSNLFLQNCVGDPPKFVLRKIIKSTADTNLMYVALQQFQEIFSEERLTNALSDLMVESASTETLLKNVISTLPKQVMYELNSKLYLSELMVYGTQEGIVNMLINNCDQYTVEILVSCLLKDNRRYRNGVKKMVTAFEQVMSYRDGSSETFWDLLFTVDSPNLIQICLKHDTICKKIFERLKDCCLSIASQLNTEQRHVDKLQLVLRIEKITKNNTLELDFTDYMKSNDFDVRTFMDYIKNK